MGHEAQELAIDVYDELKVLARRHLADERAEHTLQPTALVHEAFLKLAGQNRVSWQGRTHFLAVAATEMRRILVDYARGRATKKRGHGYRRVSLEEACVLFERNDIELLDFDFVLSKFAEVDPRASQIVEYRVFAGLTQIEIAELLKISERTIREDWKFAAAWLSGRLNTPREALS
ncbi:MAG: sigma-70 family RNA polymerase sigma factor [Phycisphaerales bacterium]|nr:sigma-70 family RNA polymerase sigma factor [Phycisphaerales bacterium]